MCSVLKVLKHAFCTLKYTIYPNAHWQEIIINKVRLEKLVISQLIKKLHAFLTPESFTKARHGSYLKPGESSPHPHFFLSLGHVLFRRPELYVLLSDYNFVCTYHLPVSAFCLVHLINLHLIILTKNNSGSTVCWSSKHDFFLNELPARSQPRAWSTRIFLCETIGCHGREN